MEHTMQTAQHTQTTQHTQPTQHTPATQHTQPTQHTPAIHYTQPTICPYDCPSSCGLLAETDGEHIYSIGGDPSHPVSKGLICKKMRHYAEEINSDARILTPLKRTGKKGEAHFTPITWEEAIDEITSRWKEIIATEGPSAIAYCYYAGVMGIVQRHCVQAFFNRMEACDLKKTLCSTAKSEGYADVVGQTGCLDPRELADSDFYLIWGSNVAATRLHTMKDLAKAGADGKRRVLIEVYAAPMAAYADEIVLIRPGTDGALALAMMHILVENKLADEEYLREYGIGYEAFKETLSEYTPAWASQITGVPADTILSLAIEYGNANSPAILLGSGNSRYGNGAMTVRLITLLSQFTGAWKRPGGGLCGCTPSGGSYFNGDLIKRTDFRKTEPGRSININQLASSLTKDSSIRSLYVAGGNPANSVSDQRAMLEGLAREDLFTVVHERFMSDTARYADIILPAAFSAEQPDCYAAYGYCTMASAKKIVNPPGSAKSNWNTISLLAKGMGYEDDYFQKTEEELCEELILTPTKNSAHLTDNERKKLLGGAALSMSFSNHTDFGTPEKKFYIVNPHIASPMPHYTPCYAENERAKETAEFFHLVSAPSKYTLNSIHQNHPALTNERGPMTLMINEKDAKRLGIKTGDRVLCFNELAGVEFTATVTELITEGALAAVGVYKLSQSYNGLTCNALHHDRLTDEGAATTMNDNLVQLKKMG